MEKMNLFGHITVALSRFPTAPYLVYPRRGRESAVSWLIEHWCKEYARVGVWQEPPPQNPKYVRDLLRGYYAYTFDNISYLHSLLDLDAAGFDCKTLWYVSDTEDLVCGADEFGRRLESQPADHMRSLDGYAPALVPESNWLQISEPKRLPNTTLFVHGVGEDKAQEEFRRPRLSFASGQTYRLTFAPPTTGRLLFVAEKKRMPSDAQNGTNRNYFLFNHAVGFEDHPVVKQGETVTGHGWAAQKVKTPEEWSLLVAVWPEGLAPEPLRLDRLFSQARGKLPPAIGGKEQKLHDKPKERKKLLAQMTEPDMRRLVHAVRSQRERPAEPQIEIMLYDVRIVNPA